MHEMRQNYKKIMLSFLTYILEHNIINNILIIDFLRYSNSLTIVFNQKYNYIII